MLIATDLRLNLPTKLENLTAADLEDLFTFSFESYFNGKVLMGTQETCQKVLDKIAEIGVDEIACLIDFGVDFVDVMASLQRLRKLKATYESPHTALLSR